MVTYIAKNVMNSLHADGFGKEQTMSRYIDPIWLYENVQEQAPQFAEKLKDLILVAPSIDIVRCRECIYYDPPHVEDDGKRIEYKDLPKEAFDALGTGLVNVTYGINVGGRCCADYNRGYSEDKRVFRSEDDFCSRGEREGE